MVQKRFLDESGKDRNTPSEKRMRTRPSFASIIGEVVMVNSLRHFCSALEPLLRRVVNEEVERGLSRGAHHFSRSPSLRIQALEPSSPSSLQLVFTTKLSLPIFTGSKIGDAENNPLQILLVDKTSNQNMVPTILPYPIKVEIVVLDGDFPSGDRDAWTSQEFNNNIVKERTGKRPLLTGELNVIMRDGILSVGDIEFTDNSSWIRSRKFRVGARVVPGNCQGIRIREAMTEAFVVKDHRGELYKKHHPPMLDDEVWRLEKIGKDGAFHKKLASERINTVQDFLKLSVIDAAKLRNILGVGMSEKMWEVTIKHARTCVMGTKIYVFRVSSSYTIFFNPICQVVKATIDGQMYSSRDLVSIINRGYIENLVKQAYASWNTLEEVDGLLNETPLLTQGELVEQCPNNKNKNQGIMVKSYTSHHQQRLVTEPTGPSNEHVESSNWVMTPTYVGMGTENCIYYNFSESSSDGADLTPSTSFSNHQFNL